MPKKRKSNHRFSGCDGDPMPSARNRGVNRNRGRGTRNMRREAVHVDRLHELLALLPSRDLSFLPTIVDEARHICNVPQQRSVTEQCLQKILDVVYPGEERRPRNEQVTVLRRLIFEKGDTILIARTGFGKSLIFHAFGVMTGFITIQIVPLSRLGEEQVQEIKRYGEVTRPCLVSAETKRDTVDLLNEVKRGTYTHILLGPEQAASKIFRQALKATGLFNLVGMVAIDECHLIKQWEEFRPTFTMIGELRMLLPQNVLWFGCTATLSAEAEKQVLKVGGFRSIGPRMYQTSIIRTSIDRPDISLCVCPIPKHETTKVNQLHFLLKDSVSGEVATPGQIPKTIVFIDGRHAIADGAAFLQGLLVKMHEQYSTNPSDGRFCVYNIIETYTAHVAEHDRNRRYDRFKQPGSDIRIIFATTSLGMGINVPDVARVCLWNFPIGKDLGDFWQRVGRGGRGKDMKSTAYIFLPYWAFDSEGKSKESTRDDAIKASTPTPISSRRGRNRLPSRRKKGGAVGPSRLNQALTPGDCSDVDEETQDSQQSQAPLPEPQELQETTQDSQERNLPFWDKADEVNRIKLDDVWKEMINGSCHRRAFLSHLNEEKAVPAPTPTPKESCCSKCNPSLYPELTRPPKEQPGTRLPTKDTRAGVALLLLQEWCVEQLIPIYSSASRRFPLHWSMFLEKITSWQLAYLYTKTTTRFDLFTADTVVRDIPTLQTWEFKSTHMEALLQRLRELPPLVLDIHQTLAAEKRRKRQEANTASGAAAVGSDTEDLGVDEAPLENTLALTVARTEAIRIAQQVNLDRAASNGIGLRQLAIAQQRVQGLQTVDDSPASRLRGWITNAASGSSELPSSLHLHAASSLRPVESAPLEIPSSVLHTMRVLESGGDTGIQNPSLPQTPSPSRQSQIPDPDSTALETPTPRAARVTTPRVARTPTPRTPRVARTPAPAPAPRKATPVPAVEGGSRRRRGSSIASSGGSSIFEESLASLPAKRARTLHWKVREADEATGGSESEDEEEI